MLAWWVLLTLFTSLSFECRTDSENNSRKKKLTWRIMKPKNSIKKKGKLQNWSLSFILYLNLVYNFSIVSI